MQMKIDFPGGVAVAAEFNGHRVLTDQTAPLGAGASPTPFDLFLVSLGTCAGYYALRFCQERSLSADGLGLSLVAERHPETRRLDAVRIEVKLPEGFPEKYRPAIVRAALQCSVKKALADPPAVEVIAV